MPNYQENIVPAQNQNRADIFIYGEGRPRVLFVGNSITKHAPKPDIGWTRDCGMAASCLENDYVHIFGREYTKKHPGASYGILQAANFERGFADFDIEGRYRDAIEWAPDVVIMFFGANVSHEYDAAEAPEVRFGDRYEALRNALGQGGARFYHAEGFYLRPKLTEERRAVCDKYGDVWIGMGGINDLPEAHGQFNHPGDLGMRLIAERMLEYVD